MHPIVAGRRRAVAERGPSTPHASGLPDVGDGQRLYWETCGDPAGVPAVVLHGGHAGGAGRSWTTLLDPGTFRIVLLDQHGCGRSLPDVADPAVPLGRAPRRRHPSVSRK